MTRVRSAGEVEDIMGARSRALDAGKNPDDLCYACGDGKLGYHVADDTFVCETCGSTVPAAHMDVFCEAD